MECRENQNPSPHRQVFKRTAQQESRVLSFAPLLAYSSKVRIPLQGFFSLGKRFKTGPRSVSSSPHRIPRQYRPGSIVEVRLKNFMNHSSLHLNLQPGVNVITGRNGAGKSAILQAIVLALGATSKETGRGITKMSEFIQRGESRAEIEVDIYNGDERNDIVPPYKVDMFKTKITFVRIIYQDSSNHILKGADGKKYFERKDALHEKEKIRTHFRFQVDNPTCVLQQEVAKHFFSITDTRDLFNFYTNATQLHRLTNSYEASTRQHKKTQVNQVRAAATKELAKLTKAQEELTRLKLSESPEDLLREVAWSKVQYTREELQKAEREAQDAKQAFKTAHEKVTELSLDRARLAKEKEELKCSIQTDKSAREDLAKNLDMKQAALAQKVQESEEMTSELSQIQARLNSKLNQEMKTKNRLRELLMKKNVSEAEKAKKVSELESEKGRVERKVAEQNEAVSNLHKALSGLEDKIRHTDRKLTNNDKVIGELKDTIRTKKRQMGESEGSNLARFARGVAALHTAIERCSSFKRKPIGPVGNYIRLRSMSSMYSSRNLTMILETIFGWQLMNTFLVDNPADRRLLIQMVKQHCPVEAPNICLSEFRRKDDVRSGRVDSHRDYHVVMEILEILDDNVFNFLIDYASIENTLIASDDDIQSLFSNSTVVPRNARRAFSLMNGSIYRYTPEAGKSNFGSYFVKTKTLHLLEKDKNDLRRSYEEEIGKYELLLQKEFSERSTNAATVEEVVQRVNNLSQEKVKAERDRKKSQKALNGLNEQLHGLSMNSACEVKRLQKEQADLTVDLVSLRAEQKSLKEKQRSLQNAVTAEQQEYERLRVRYGEWVLSSTKETRLEQLEADESDNKNQMRATAPEFRKAKGRFAESERAQQAAIQKYKAALEAADRKYSNVGDTIEARPFQVLDALVKSNSNDKRRVEELTNAIVEMEANYALKDRAAHILEKSHQEHLESLMQRKGRLKILKNSAVRCLRREFTSRLEVFDMEGDIDIDDEEKTFKLHVSVRGDNGEEFCDRDALTLSGGERTKTLVCLIMALWEYQDPPFRCLDEWDVFLDLKSREVIEAMLCEYGKLKDRKFQSILISPARCQFDGVHTITIGETFTKSTAT